MLVKVLAYMGLLIQAIWEVKVQINIWFLEVFIYNDDGKEKYRVSLQNQDAISLLFE